REAVERFGASLLHGRSAFEGRESTKVAGATLPIFHSSNANRIVTFPVAAAPSTRTVSCSRQLQHRCLSTARTCTAAAPGVLLGNSRTAVGNTFFGIASLA